MNRNLLRYLAVSAPGLVLATIVVAADPDLKTIMQGLRDDTAAVADGLLTDDFDKVASAASRIAGHDRIPTEQVKLVAAELGPEMPAFKQFDEQVHDLSLALAAAAQAQDRSTAIDAYQRMLGSCFACHGAYKDRVSAVLSAARENQDVGPQP